MTKLLIIITFVFITLATYMYWRNRSPSTIGVVNGRLQPCRETPNCVSSYSKRQIQLVKPFPIKNSANTSLNQIAHIIKQMPRSQIIKKESNYLHAEFKSKTFGFVDDLEFLINHEKNRIDVRSAARVGYSDLGVNRQRVEMIRDKYLKKD